MTITVTTEDVEAARTDAQHPGVNMSQILRHQGRHITCLAVDGNWQQAVGLLASLARDITDGDNDKMPRVLAEMLTDMQPAGFHIPGYDWVIPSVCVVDEPDEDEDDDESADANESDRAYDRAKDYELLGA